MVAIDIPMPRRCEECPFWDGQACVPARRITLRTHGKEKPDWCFLIEIPEECAGCSELIARKL